MNSAGATAGVLIHVGQPQHPVLESGGQLAHIHRHDDHMNPRFTRAGVVAVHACAGRGLPPNARERKLARTASPLRPVVQPSGSSG